VAKINIQNFQTTIAVRPGYSLLNTLLNEELPIHTVCGGRARCGCCRIRIITGAKVISPVNDWEKIRLTAEELATGWRLACQAHSLRDITIHLPISEELEPVCSKKI
jgi:ferredoxin